MKFVAVKLLNWVISHPWLTMIISLVVPFIWIAVALYNPLFLLSENQNLYVFSTQSQVLSAIYGLTLTGYIFLRNHQEREVEKDNSLSDIIKTIQKKEYSFLIMLTIVSIFAILLDLLTLSMYLSNNRLLNILVKNSATALFVNSLILISLFILKALKADKYNEVSKEIMMNEERNIRIILGKEPDSKNKGDNELNNNYFLYGLFMDSFIELEQNICKLYDMVYSKKMTSAPNANDINRRLSLSRMLKDLSGSNVLPPFIAPEISALIKYRNALVHTNDVDPSQHMVDSVTKINEKIRKVLKESL
ncbi:hypothetical protein [Escherichia albertii]|uniref:hypothetical protein n=2 Tax=Escherichia albertii TaxID=208962 RepID=UPI0007434A18|nr:hypothetical protein [Escherichia albertii]EJI9008428.1 hypothetical protein [Escherichia albertii]EJQ6144565.1 hypothetical protein [Escherichia albertii]EJS1735034.1 hypothetical protein [Escherichia albertii]MCE7711896.1 hypothetical protein [Escherichia albertii]MCQ8914197.1 hypothetical protein [Escherichia albertii]